MAEFVTKIHELPIASDRAKADIAGNSIVDTYATKTEGSMVSTSEGASSGYLSDVLKSGDGITLTETNGVISANANIKILPYNGTITSEKWQDLHDSIAAGDITLFCKRINSLFPMSYVTDSEIAFYGCDITSSYNSKFRTLHLNSSGTWSENANIFLPSTPQAGTIIRGASCYGTKSLTAKTDNYWTGYWIPIVKIPIGRFNMRIMLNDTTSAYHTNIIIDLMGIDKNWLTASYCCLNPERDYLRIWNDGSNWVIGFDGIALSDSPHTFQCRLDSLMPQSFSVVADELRIDPSTLSISGVHLQKPVSNTLPDWSQTSPTSDTAELNPEQGSTELS